MRPFSGLDRGLTVTFVGSGKVLNVSTRQLSALSGLSTTEAAYACLYVVEPAG